MDLMMICPDVCTQQTYIYITVLGFLFGFLAVILFLLRKKGFSKWRLVLFWVFLIFFLLFSVQIEYNSCGSGCLSDGVYFEGLQLLPNNIFPYSTIW